MSRVPPSPLAAVLLLAGSGMLPAADGDPVSAGQRVEDLLGAARAPAGGAAPPPAAAGGSPTLRLILGAGALAVLGGALAIAARRRRARLGGAPAAEAIDVVGRAALSHRHSIYIVRAAGRRIVLGVAGERMTALAVIEERAAEPPPARGFTSRLGDLTRRPPVREPPPADLEPYRRQVDRLRGMLREPLDGPPPEEP